MSTAAQRAKRKAEVDHAYGEVARAATWGALKYGLFGVSAVTMAHFTWPTFRRQTLAFKGFITMGCNVTVPSSPPFPLVLSFPFSVICTGLVMHGEAKLLSHEREVRLSEGKLRREARIDLARRGLVGTESEIAKWKEEREKRLAQQRAQQMQNMDGNENTEAAAATPSG